MTSSISKGRLVADAALPLNAMKRLDRLVRCKNHAEGAIRCAHGHTTALAYRAGLRRAPRQREQWSVAELRRPSLRPEGANTSYWMTPCRHRFRTQN